MTGIPAATVAELDADYITKMEDVLEVYEGHTIRKSRWSAWTRSRFTQHADVRPSSRRKPSRRFCSIAVQMVFRENTGI